MGPVRKSGIVLLSIAATLSVSICSGQSTPSCTLYMHEVKPDSKYSFAQATLIALVHAREAWQEAADFQAEQKPDDDPQTSLIGMMRHTKNASDAYTCAGLALEPYKKSHDEKMIGFTADFEVAVYKQHRFLNDTFLDTLRKLPTLSGQQTKLADIISTIEVERKKLWKDLIKGTTLTLIGLLDQTKPGKGDVLDTLVITRAERQKLLDRILQSFP
jgi:hypothetical protein